MSGRDERAALGSLIPDGSDDLDRAVQTLALAVKDYAADTHMNGGQPA